MPNKPRTYRPPAVPTMAATSTGKANAREIRSSGRWNRLRRVKLNMHPLCQHPDCSPRQPATQVHHIQPVESYPQLAYNLDNLASICVACHGKVSQLEKSGKAVALPWRNSEV